MKNIYEHVRRAFESKILMGVLCGIGIAIIAMLIFSAGMAVGFHKASFGRAWGEHYSENFGMGRPGGYVKGITEKIHMPGYFPNAHGAAGKIIKIELPNIMVEDKDGTEKTISTNMGTQIQEGRETVTVNDLKVDDFVVVIGTPNDKGIIEAKLIRLIPSPESLQ